MSASAADIAEVRRLVDEPPAHDAADFSPLESAPAVIGFTIACARAEGEDEVELVELVVRAADLSPDAVRGAERILRPLGYVQVCDMLRKIAGRRKHSLVPLTA
jgi:hypothetical protein